MADVKKTSAYYSLVGKCRRVSRQISLSINEEECERHRKTYEGLVKQWEQLERKGGVPLGRPPGAWYFLHRPLFNEAYVQSTLQLREMYKARESMTHSERQRYNSELFAVLDHRRTVTTFVDVRTEENESAV